MQKILVIQTAFIGDVVLSTALIESLHNAYPSAAIDVLVRKGNESLFEEHPFLHHVLIWDKKKSKYINWLRILFQIRAAKYDEVINVQRYAATGFWTALSGATQKIGFDKNPLSFLFTHRIAHDAIQGQEHEIKRNHALLQPLGDIPLLKPALYPSAKHVAFIAPYQSRPYICIAPASVWFTKQYPFENWVKFMNEIPFEGTIYLLGGPGDHFLCEQIRQASIKKGVENMAGKLSFLASAALQKKAVINYVNDSAPMHFASSMNAPVVAIYCSTIPAFGYGPLSDQSFIVETRQFLACRPCGMHGKKQCPLKHFNCANTIELNQLVAPLLEMTQH